MEKDKRKELMSRLSRAWDEVMGSSERRRIRRIWQSAKAGTPPKDEDQQLAKILMEHEEFEKFWKTSDVGQAMDRPAGVNPFLHVSLHLIIENQLAQNNPPQVHRFYLREVDKGVPRHPVIHRIAAVFSEILFDTLRYRNPFNRKKYIQLLEEEAERES